MTSDRASNIAIAGCGPAGLAAALLLHRHGHKVSLFERFAEPQPVGSGIILQPTGLAVLRELKLADAMHQHGSRIDRIVGLARPSGRVVLNVNYSALGAGFHGLAVHRAALFERLYAAARDSGIDIRCSAEVADVSLDNGGVALRDANNEALGRFDLLVDASGARSTLRRFAAAKTRWRELRYGAIWGNFDWPDDGFDPAALEQRYVAAHTMVGVLPIGRHASQAKSQVAFFWSLKTADHPAWLAAGLEHWKAEVRAIWPQTESILQQVSDPSQMTLARYGHTTLAKPYGERIAFIGDAAHSTSPQLGQGANMALLDAWSLAAALNSTADIHTALTQYARERRWHVRAFQLSSLAMTPFYQSDSRLLAAMRDLLFDPVSKLPIARRIVAGLISGMLAGPPKDLDYRSQAAQHP